MSGLDYFFERQKIKIDLGIIVCNKTANNASSRSGSEIEESTEEKRPLEKYIYFIEELIFRYRNKNLFAK